VTGEWKKLHNEELHTLYSSLRRIRLAGRVARVEKSNVHRLLVGKS
jgi:hypothetical protein